MGEEPKLKQRLGRIVIDGKVYKTIEEVPEEFRERVRARLADLEEKPLHRSPSGQAAAKSEAAGASPANSRLGVVIGLLGALAAAGAAAVYLLR